MIRSLLALAAALAPASAYALFPTYRIDEPADPGNWFHYTIADESDGPHDWGIDSNDAEPGGTYWPLDSFSTFWQSKPIGPASRVLLYDQSQLQFPLPVEIAPDEVSSPTQLAITLDEWIPPVPGERPFFGRYLYTVVGPGGTRMGSAPLLSVPEPSGLLLVVVGLHGIFSHRVRRDRLFLATSSRYTGT